MCTPAVTVPYTAQIALIHTEGQRDVMQAQYCGAKLPHQYLAVREKLPSLPQDVLQHLDHAFVHIGRRDVARGLNDALVRIRCRKRRTRLSHHL